MPKKDPSLGRSLIRAHKKRNNFVIKDNFRHTSDIQDGRDFGRLNLKSVTERSTLDEFLHVTALAERDFTAELSNIKIVDPDTANGILTEKEKNLIESIQNENRDILCIPRRPHWDSDTSKEELDAMEREEFLSWRKKLSLSQEEEHINLTPYEKNLEVWRQLWRVTERSDVVVQILDARNPLLFRCDDLETYVKEVDARKINVLLLNKADFLTEAQRQHWCDYFDKNNIQVAFFSAVQQMEEIPEDNLLESSSKIEEKPEQTFEPSQVKNSPKVLSRNELISFFKNIGKMNKQDKTKSTIGFVGYPNVGKSSTINAILMAKRVTVSATPGKTKHFQTHVVDDELCLCDCPGLVFPNFVCTKAEMVINGILPIDQLTNWVQPISLIVNVIPKHILQSTYNILISVSDETDSRVPTAEEFLNAYGYNRGYMTQRGIPDNARSARYVLKDFVNGKLLYCHAPPGVQQELYHTFPNTATKKQLRHKVKDENNEKRILTEADKVFFSKCDVHYKGKAVNSVTDQVVQGKPWKKHYNRNKREKLRRVYYNSSYT